MVAWVMIGMPCSWFPYDLMIYIWTALFALIQGWTATSIFIIGPARIKDSGLGGMLMSFSLLFGIMTGSLISFLITT